MLLRILPLAAIFLLVTAQYNNQRSPYQQQAGQQQYPNNQNNQFQQNRQLQQNQQNPNLRPQQNYQQQSNQYPNQQPQQQLQQPQQQLQQQQQQQQYGMQNQQQGNMNNQNPQFFGNGQQMSRSAVSTNPLRMTNSSDLGALVTIQLRQYSNPQNSLDADTTCACPTINCDFLRQNEQNNCMFSFMVVISSADQTVKMIQSDFYPFSQSINQGNWTTAITLQVPTKPSAIDVFVQHLGAVIRKQTAQLLYFNNRLTLVDAFAIPLLQIDPTSGNGRVSSTQLGSTLQQGNTRVTWARICDLKCGTLGNQNSDVVLCQSSYDGTIQSCRYNSGRSQVQSCTVCSNYNTTSNTCTDYAGPIDDRNLVKHAYRTWTIVLGVLLGLALLLILCLIIAYIILRNREQEEYDQAPSVYKPPATTTGTTNGHTAYNSGTTARRDSDNEWASPARQPLIDRGHDDVYRTTTTTHTQQRQEHAV
ncbi:unnamed protein product, partial [Mesorhabditis belari]|uniref:Uncharacterized protein n=1 Tax=Mesorhabditis belari TaxID=2138241 RepID=A0AAF3FQE6_9BILA